ncbi:MAG TPA: glycosyltransferase family 9 protein, partial [Candidatus Tumulicola sp.]
MPETSPSVLVIRLDGIGDALALTPLLAAFQTEGVAADLVLSAGNASIFAPGAVRRVEIAPWQLRSNAPADRSAMLAFAREMSTRDYTHVLVATEDPSGYRVARESNVARRIGFENGWGKPFKSLWVRAQLTQTVRRSAGLDARGKHEAEVLFELGRGLIRESKPTVDLARLRPVVLTREMPRDPRIVFQVSDKWERLGISLDDVALAFRQTATIATVRPIASASERDYAARFEAITGANVDRFDRLDEWKAAIASARAVVAPDSGAVHVAGTIGTPVTAVFPGSAQFELQTARWRPWAAPYRIVRSDNGWPYRVASAVSESIA